MRVDMVVAQNMIVRVRMLVRLADQRVALLEPTEFPDRHGQHPSEQEQTHDHIAQGTEIQVRDRIIPATMQAEDST